MDQEKAITAARRMTEARARLIRDNPFFGHLAMGLHLACADCVTACTDGTSLVFDPEFAEKLTDRELEFVLLHEVLHCVLEHCMRGRSLDQAVFNIACDIVVNSTIMDMWGDPSFMVAGEVPMHKAPDRKEGREYSAEEVYRMLLHAEKDGHVSGLPGTGLPPACSEEGGDGSPGSGHGHRTKAIDRHDVWQGIADAGRLRDVWKKRILQAAEECPDPACVPQKVRNLVDMLVHRSKVNWKHLLHDFLQQDAYDYTFLPPDRRYAGTDYFLPAYNPDEEGNASGLWVCIDTSASISDEELTEAMLEVQDAMRQAGLSGVISFFDSGVTEPRHFTAEEEIQKIVPRGGGGTSFHAVFRYMKENMAPDLPKAVLIFTDGYAPWPEEAAAMDVPVLWLIRKGGRTSAPWGRVVEF